MKATTNAQQPLFIEAVRDLMASGAEMSSALVGVQLCAPEYVIAAGQAVTEAIQPDAEERTNPRNTPSMPTNHADAPGNSNSRQSQAQLWTVCSTPSLSVMLTETRHRVPLSTSILTVPPNFRPSRSFAFIEAP